MSLPDPTFHIRAAVVCPQTGATAPFALDAVAGLRLGLGDAAGLEVFAAHPTAADGMRRAVESGAHALFGPYGSSAMLDAAAATDRVIWNHGGATSALRWDRFPHLINVLSPASSYFHGTLEAAHAADAGFRTVAILHARTGFATDVALGAAAKASALGFSVSTGAFERGGGAEAAARAPDAEVLLVVGGFADELAVAQSITRGRWRVLGFVGAGVDEVLAALGEAREGLVGPAQWTAETAPTPDEGPDAASFVDRFADATGHVPPYPAAQAFAAGTLFARCVRDAGTVDDRALFDVARALRCRTLYGDFTLDPDTGLQVGHQVLTVQWQNGRRRVVWPPDRAEARLLLRD